MRWCILLYTLVVPLYIPLYTWNCINRSTTRSFTWLLALPVKGNHSFPRRILVILRDLFFLFGLFDYTICPNNGDHFIQLKREILEIISGIEFSTPPQKKQRSYHNFLSPKPGQEKAHSFSFLFCSESKIWDLSVFFISYEKSWRAIALNYFSAHLAFF